MTKLTNAQFSWAVRNVTYGRITAKKAALALGVSKRRVLQLVGKFHQSGQMPKINK
ncbi:hypothetical protein HY994_06965, partial [Candidatus Micrarchaeota archaeon]|nr:hypothetical protein [Candidatus Micrarchaeota archaeon]